MDVITGLNALPDTAQWEKSSGRRPSRCSFRAPRFRRRFHISQGTASRRVHRGANPGCPRRVGKHGENDLDILGRDDFKTPAHAVVVRDYAAIVGSAIGCRSETPVQAEEWSWQAE